MQDDLSLLALFWHASLLVKFVMLALLAASLASWALIYLKWKQLREAAATANTFESRFWSGIDLVELFRQTSAREDEQVGLAAVFTAGFGEFARLRKQGGVEPMALVEGAQRAMRAAVNRELEALERSLAFLATVGSTSPYVGLFGTVWGIMNSFRSLGNMHQATIAVVAPGIAEALIATAMGLFAAIPAVVAYNRFTYDLERRTSQLETFQEEFTTLLQRQAHTR